MQLPDYSDPRSRLLGNVLARNAEQVPDRDFIVWDEEHYTYARVNELANASARGFSELGVGRGDTVSYFLRTSPAWIWTTLALAKLGAIWVPTNVDYKGRWLAESFEDGGAETLIAEADLLDRVEALGSIPFRRVLVAGATDRTEVLGAPIVPLDSVWEKPGPEPDDRDLDYGDTSSIIWTSGTTGRAKGVEQSHNVWVRGALDGAINAGVREDEIIYNCLPMYQSGAWVANIYRALVAQVTCAMDPQFSAGEFWNRTRHYGATMIFTLGAMHMFLIQAQPRDDDAENPVRVASFIPLPENLIPVVKERFGIDEIHQGYGQSEVMTLIARKPGRAHKPNSLGEAADGLEIKILGDDDREVAAGDVGEFCVRPTVPHAIFNGYRGNPAATVRAWRNLWYHTGDLGRMDEDGEFFFVDRKADFIRFKGRNISSFAVEAAVGAHPAVAQCAAHGVVSEHLEAEAELKVCVVLKEGESASADEIARFVNDNAPYFFVPRYIEFLDALPRTPTGRVQKYLLRERGVTSGTWDADAAGFVVER